MLIERLQISHFRNLSGVVLEPGTTLNFLVGNNGQGKTSVLEAIGILGSLRSFRESKPIDWIQQGALHSELHATVVPSQDDLHWRSDLALILHREHETSSVKKTVQVNQKAIRSSVHYLRMKFGSAELALHTIAFNPNDHDLVRGDPAGRRAYLDRVLSAENPHYFENLLRYQKALDQRNSLLKEHNRRLHTLLPEFTEPLIQHGSVVIHERLKWFQTRSQRISEIAQIIAPLQATLRPVYEMKWLQKDDTFSSENESLSLIHFTGHSPIPSLEELESFLRVGFKKVAADELRLGSTLIGPHREDWSLEYNDKPLKGRGSQGEVRTALLALKLTEIESFRSVTQHRPILLLDDFSSELDLERRQYLMNFLATTDLQVFISSTESLELPGRKFLVEGGTVSPLLKG